jgi:hypothetical protein
MRVFCVFVTAAACLLWLSGCGAGNTTISSLDPRQGETALEAPGSIATDEEVMARGRAESGTPNDESRERHFLQANFGLDDPGVIVIRADQGGDINWYESKYFGAGSGTTRWVVDGYCNSACTMVLGTGHVCATRRAQFGFHAGYTYFGFFEVPVPQFTYLMYRHYPDDVKDWVDRHHAMEQITMTMMRQPEVATYVPSCRV